MKPFRKTPTIAAIATIGSIATFAFATSLVTDLSDQKAAKELSYDERPTAAEYWEDFTQDSKQSWATTKDAFRDGWLEGKLETALVLNEHLNPFDIDINVNGSDAVLRGTVDSDIDKELAENVALGIDGIDSVSNELEVSKDTGKTVTQDEHRSFLQYMDDVSTTASIKSKLISSDHIKGLKINVDTHLDTVTLSGKVETEEQKDLAGAIAARQDGVDKVINKLQVQS